MAKVSVVILARNEEKFIGACIASVKDFADEIVVVDDFSTDKTAEICKSLGARVVQRALNGDFGAQQTFAIQQATCDWIFIIDADERATPELSAEIKKIIAQDDKNFAYRCARLSHFWGKPIRHGGWFPDYVTRLLPKAGTYVTGYVHQKINHICAEKNLDAEKYLIHYPYRDWENYFSKMNTYSTLMAKKMHADGKRAGVFDIVAHPIWAWLKMYVFRGGYRDGLLGFILASFNCYYTMSKYVKLYYFDKENRHD